MAYSQPTSAAPEVHTPVSADPAAGRAASKPHSPMTPTTDGGECAVDEQWSVVRPFLQQGPQRGLSRHTRPHDQAPRRPGSQSLKTSRVAVQLQKPSMQNFTTPQQLLQQVMRRHFGTDADEPFQTRSECVVASAIPTRHPGDGRNITIPMAQPRIPGCVNPWASRSASFPEKRAPEQFYQKPYQKQYEDPNEKPHEKPYYRPMNGIPPPSLAASRRPQHPFTNIAPLGAAPTAHIILDDKSVSSNKPNHTSLTLALEKVKLGFSPGYNGDPYLPRNRSADVPNELNCSLFLVNLPPDLTTNRLIAAVHAMGPTGRIYATHINAPEPERHHYGCAAKVIFFERRAAHDFYALCEAYGFHVDGFAARVMWNRIKTAEQSSHSRATTRVLLIGGDRRFVNPGSLTEYFGTKLQFQIDCIIPHTDGLDGQNAVVEYRFGSFRCQAEAAKMALVREHPDVKCFFHQDPCDPIHPDWTEKDIAWMQRLRARRNLGGLEVVPEAQEGQEFDGVYGAAD